MTSASVRGVGFIVAFLAFSSLSAHAAEPLSGRWRLISQEVAGQKTAIEQLILRVNPAGQKLEFAYSVPVNDIQFVSLRFSAPLDGTESDVTNSDNRKIGTVKVTKLGGSSYKIVLQGHDRPTASGTMTVSSDGKTLKSESESSVSGRPTVVRTVQIFSRQ